MIDNPVWSGFVTNTVMDDREGLELDITMHWQAKAEGHPAYSSTIFVTVLEGFDSKSSVSMCVP